MSWGPLFSSIFQRTEDRIQCVANTLYHLTLSVTDTKQNDTSPVLLNVTLFIKYPIVFISNNNLIFARWSLIQYSWPTTKRRTGVSTCLCTCIRSSRRKSYTIDLKYCLSKRSFLLACSNFPALSRGLEDSTRKIPYWWRSTADINVASAPFWIFARKWQPIRDVTRISAYLRHNFEIFRVAT